MRPEIDAGKLPPEPSGKQIDRQREAIHLREQRNDEGREGLQKDWCGVEFRVVKEIIFSRQHARVMFIKMDDASVDGVFKADAYVDARKFSPSKIAEFICERLQVLAQADGAD